MDNIYYNPPYCEESECGGGGGGGDINFIADLDNGTYIAKSNSDTLGVAIANDALSSVVGVIPSSFGGGVIISGEGVEITATDQNIEITTLQNNINISSADSARVEAQTTLSLSGRGANSGFFGSPNDPPDISVFSEENEATVRLETSGEDSNVAIHASGVGDSGIEITMTASGSGITITNDLIQITSSDDTSNQIAIGATGENAAVSVGCNTVFLLLTEGTGFQFLGTSQTGVAVDITAVHAALVALGIITA